MAIGVEVSTITENPLTQVLLASTIRPKFNMLNSKTVPVFTKRYDNVIFTEYSRSIQIINKEFCEFLSNLDQHDKDAIISAVDEINSYPFVKKLDFRNYGVPTIVIETSVLNKDCKNKIYGIEYRLLKEISVDIDFYIKPF